MDVRCGAFHTASVTYWARQIHAALNQDRGGVSKSLPMWYLKAWMPKNYTMLSPQIDQSYNSEIKSVFFHWIIACSLVDTT